MKTYIFSVPTTKFYKNHRGQSPLKPLSVRRVTPCVIMIYVCDQRHSARHRDLLLVATFVDDYVAVVVAIRSAC